MQLLSAFGGGLFLIPLLLLIAASYSAYRGYKASKSGSTIQGKYGSTTGSKQNVPFYQTGGGIFSIILFAALILIIILMVNER